MKKILLITLGIILLVGIITASAISFSNYSKVREKTEIETEGICDEKECDKNTPKNLSLSGSNLKIDVLKDPKTNREVLNIYSE